MKVELWLIGKTSFDYLNVGIDLYEKRLKHYLPFSITTFPDAKKYKNAAEAQLKQAEGKLILDKLNSSDCLIVLDERGKSFDSVGFAQHLESMLSHSYKRLVFVVGGAYGFSPSVYERADYKLSLSKMTFSHQMVRLFFVEQLYRAMTIIRREPYHHQ